MVERALFVDPAFFDVEYVINPHMQGMVGAVDRERAQRQWSRLVEVYRSLGFDCHVVPPVAGLPDLCFVANQSFPVGPRTVVLSVMHAAQRAPEVAVLAEWYRDRGYSVLGQECTTVFEAMGDVAWHPGRRVLYGGHGYRTQREAYEERAALFGARVVPLELVDPRFYHLDTCFSALDAHTALVVPCAFSAEGLATLEQAFDVLIECPEDEAERFLACNGHCPDQKHFVVDAGASRTMAVVREAGFEPIGVDTSEFRKSGGSVQCLKLMLDEAPDP